MSGSRLLLLAAIALAAVGIWALAGGSPGWMGPSRVDRVSDTGTVVPAGAEADGAVQAAGTTADAAAAGARRAAAAPPPGTRLGLEGHIVFTGDRPIPVGDTQRAKLHLRIWMGAGRATPWVVPAPEGRFRLEWEAQDDGTWSLPGGEAPLPADLEAVTFRVQGVHAGQQLVLQDVSVARADGETRRSYADLGLPFGTTGVEVEVARQPTVVLDVRDAQSDEPLAGITVQLAAPPRNPLEDDIPRPAARGSASTLADGASSPVELRWDSAWKRVSEPVDVLCSGYAPARLLVDRNDGGTYSVKLEPAAALRVRFGGAQSGEVELAVIQLGVDEAAFRGSVDPRVDWSAKDLAPGTYLVWASEEDGARMAATRCVLERRQETAVALELGPDELAAPLEILFDLPADRELPPTLRLVLRHEAPGQSLVALPEVTVSKLERVPAADGRQRLLFRAEDLPPGRGVAHVDDLLMEGAYVHDPADPRPVVLVEPGFVEVDIVCVDGQTGAIVPHTRVEVGSVIDGHQRWDAVFEAKGAPGHFRVRCPGRETVLWFESAHGYTEGNRAFDAAAATAIEVRLDPLPSQLVGLMDASGQPVDWPVGEPAVLEKEGSPEATTRAEFEAGGVRLWVDRGGFWTLRFPNLPGFRTGQSHTLWFGENTEPLMVRIRLEQK